MSRRGIGEERLEADTVSVEVMLVDFGVATSTQRNQIGHVVVVFVPIDMMHVKRPAVLRFTTQNTDKAIAFSDRLPECSLNMGGYESCEAPSRQKLQFSPECSARNPASCQASFILLLIR